MYTVKHCICTASTYHRCICFVFCVVFMCVRLYLGRAILWLCSINILCEPATPCMHMPLCGNSSGPMAYILDLVRRQNLQCCDLKTELLVFIFRCAQCWITRWWCLTCACVTLLWVSNVTDHIRLQCFGWLWRPCGLLCDPKPQHALWALPLSLTQNTSNPTSALTAGFWLRQNGTSSHSELNCVCWSKATSNVWVQQPTKWAWYMGRVAI